MRRKEMQRKTPKNNSRIGLSTPQTILVAPVVYRASILERVIALLAVVLVNGHFGITPRGTGPGTLGSSTHYMCPNGHSWSGVRGTTQYVVWLGLLREPPVPRTTFRMCPNGHTYFSIGGKELGSQEVFC